MCGIFCCLSHTSQLHSCLKNSNVMHLLENRGPDAKQIKQSDNITFGGFVLWHQGTKICIQPVETDTHILLYNGDMFNENNINPQDISDTKWIFDQLSTAESEVELVTFIKTIEGPYSIIFYDKVKKFLYFFRDSLGRNSLLIENNTDHMRLLSTSYNIGIENSTMELPPLGIYKVTNDGSRNFYLFPWRPLDNNNFSQLNQLEKNLKVNINIMHHVEHTGLIKEIKIKMHHYSFYDMINRTFSSTSDLYDFLLKDDDISEAIHNFSELLADSVRKRVQYTTKFCAACLQQKLCCNHSKIAILFSGGIDCSILTVLSDKFVPKTDTIDLVNVAFENTNTDIFNVPDRISAKASFQNLKDICPERQWNFIEVNVTKEELYENLTKHIKHLIFPLKTVLDESIGCAFWFASRAMGLKGNLNWESSARIVILGSGADELFGGYVRHKNAYTRYNGTEAEKQENLLKELEKDWNRIPSRNLARDDRVISDNGRTPRAPFIEEKVVNFARSLLPNQRCCFLLDDGIGDKLFLRLYGYYLGLKSSAFLKKRAIQFGSRIANKKQNATDQSAYL